MSIFAATPLDYSANDSLCIHRRIPFVLLTAPSSSADIGGDGRYRSTSESSGCLFQGRSGGTGITGTLSAIRRTLADSSKQNNILARRLFLFSLNIRINVGSRRGSENDNFRFKTVAPDPGGN
jgi:hypothetical protein